MRAVLFNQADVRLGEVTMPDDCRLIIFGGMTFVRTDVATVLDGGGMGVAFEAPDRHVVEVLDIYNPRSSISGPPPRQARRAPVQGRPAPAAEVDEEEPE